jgi:hypothetical protein
MMMNPGKQTYRPQIRSLWIWALLVAVLMAVLVPGAQAALSENRTRACHNFFADRTGLEPDLNAELHWVYGNFYDDFASGSLVAPKRVPNFGKSVQKAWNKGTFYKKSHSIQHHYNQQVTKRGLDLSVKQYTKEAQSFFKKYSNSPQYVKEVPLKSGAGTALRINVGNKMGVFTKSGKILTYHP